MQLLAYTPEDIAKVFNFIQNVKQAEFSSKEVRELETILQSGTPLTAQAQKPELVSAPEKVQEK